MNEDITEQQVLQTIKYLANYLRDQDAVETEAIENALYNLRDLIR